MRRMGMKASMSVRAAGDRSSSACMQFLHGNILVFALFSPGLHVMMTVYHIVQTTAWQEA